MYKDYNETEARKGHQFTRSPNTTASQQHRHKTPVPLVIDFTAGEIYFATLQQYIERI